MSVPQTPQVATLMRTSPSPTSGTGTSSTRTIPFSRSCSSCLGNLSLMQRECFTPSSQLGNETVKKASQRFGSLVALPAEAQESGNAFWLPQHLPEHAFQADVARPRDC